MDDSVSTLIDTMGQIMTMRGATVVAFGGPENIKVSNDLSVPALATPDQVLIDVRTAGVNPVDTYIRAGTFALLPPLPYVPGIDGAGVVREIGAAVTHLAAGDRVWFYTYAGATAEVTAATHTSPLPKALSFVEGACLGIPYTTAYRALFTKGQIKVSHGPIHGASGGVGLAACQLAAFARAALVVGTAGTQAGLEAVRRNGAHHAVNHREEGYVDKLREISPEGFDLIIEMAAGTNLATDIDLLARGGRVGIVGGFGTVPISTGTLYGKEAVVYGVVAHGASREHLFECAALLERMFAETEHRPVVNKSYALDETALCHADLRDVTLLVCELLAVLVGVVCFLVLSFLGMFYILKKETIARSTQSSKKMHRSLHVLFVQLAIPLFVVVFPGFVVFLGIATESLISFGVSLAMFYLTRLHSIVHNVSLLSLTNAYRDFLLSVITCGRLRKNKECKSRIVLKNESVAGVKR